MSKTTLTTAAEAAEIYRGKGFARPTAVLSSTEKFPPEKGTTGNVEPERARELAEKTLIDHRGNVALVMDSGTDAYDIIAVDMDVYDEKDGYAEWLKLCDRLGVEFVESLRTSRRGVESKSGKRLYRTRAKGARLSSNPVPGVEICQYHHRYVVCAPSVVEGKAEQWISAEGVPLAVEDIPCAGDLPFLPEALEAHLTDGTRSDPHPPAEDYGDDAARAWLEEVTRNPSGTPTGALAATEFSAAALPGLFSVRGGRYDTMLGLTHRLIRVALESGAEGLSSVLADVEKAYCGAFKQGERPVAGEFSKAVRGAVNKARGEVEAGLFHPVALVLSGVDPEAFTALRTGYTAETDPYDALDAVRRRFYGYRGDDLPARLLLDLCGDLQLWKSDVTTKHGDLSLYDVEDGHTVRTVPTFRPYLRRFVAPVVEALKASLADPDTLPDAEKAEAEFLTKECARVLKACHYERDAAPVLSAVVGLLNETGTPLLESEADGDDTEHLLGLSDGSVIDLSLWGDGVSLPESVRPRRRDEILTKSLNLSGAEIAHYSAELERMVEAGETPEAAELFRTVFGEATTTALECMAYSLHGSNPHRLIWGVMGATGTGKSTVMGFLEQTLGNYSAPVAMEELCKRGGTNSEKVAALRARVAFMSEFSQDVRGSRDALKEIAGNEKVAAAAKFANTEYHRGTVLTFSTNEPARIDFDAALEDRFVVVPVACTQEEFRRVRGRVADLWSVAPLNRVWLLSVLADNYRTPRVEGFQRSRLPECVQDTSARFVAESNPANAFVTEALELTGDPADYVLCTKMREELNAHCELELSAQKVTEVMARHGLERKKVKILLPHHRAKSAQNVYLGVKFRDLPELDAAEVA